VFLVLFHSQRSAVERVFISVFTEMCELLVTFLGFDGEFMHGLNESFAAPLK